MPDEDKSSIYSRLVEFIEEAENAEYGARKSYASIDLDVALSAALTQKRRSYEEAIESISGVEAPRRMKEEKPKEEKPKEHMIVAGLEQSKYSAPTPSPFIKEEEAAKREIEAIRGKFKEIKPAIKGLGMKRVSTKDLILPSLSISDQIAELERIIEGVKGNIFDEEHLAVVKQEVYGLNSIVKRSELERRKSAGKPASAIEESLLSVRRQRLQDALNLLQNR